MFAKSQATDNSLHHPHSITVCGRDQTRRQKALSPMCRFPTCRGEMQKLGLKGHRRQPFKLTPKRAVNSWHRHQSSLGSGREITR